MGEKNNNKITITYDEKFNVYTLEIRQKDNNKFINNMILNLEGITNFFSMYASLKAWSTSEYFYFIDNIMKLKHNKKENIILYI